MVALILEGACANTDLRRVSIPRRAWEVFRSLDVPLSPHDTPGIDRCVGWKSGRSQAVRVVRVNVIAPSTFPTAYQQYPTTRALDDLRASDYHVLELLQRRSRRVRIRLAVLLLSHDT